MLPSGETLHSTHVCGHVLCPYRNSLQNIKAQNYTSSSKWAAFSYLFLLNDIKSGNCLKNLWHLPKIFPVEQLNYMVTKVHMGQRMGLWEESVDGRWFWCLESLKVQLEALFQIPLDTSTRSWKVLSRKTCGCSNDPLVLWLCGHWKIMQTSQSPTSQNFKTLLTNALLFWFSWVADATWMIFRFINKYKGTD